MKRENLEKEQETVAQATLFSDWDFEAPRPERVKRTVGLGMWKKVGHIPTDAIYGRGKGWVKEVGRDESYDIV